MINITRSFILLLLCLGSFHGFSQTMRIAGNVQDTVAKAPLQHAVAIAIRIRDSTLVAHGRTNSTGMFELNKMPIDTYQVIISHPLFSDQNYYVFGSAASNQFDFGKIVLPSKSHDMSEVVIFGFKDPIYYRGDTLVFTADSFKVKKNGTVEDLLKKLPGIKVDSQGKITAQGKKVDQVLVDGDEFFGTDPTAATKNLSATDVESVQVYDKKNDNAAAGTDEEALKIMNLKLKEEAKKGYFGKMSGASDFDRFYEGEMLANRFNTKRKVSVFGLASNTPRSNFGWQDRYKYGLMEWEGSEMDDGMYMFTSNEDDKNGIPKTLRGGIYYSDKWTKKTKVNINYSFNQNDLEANSSSRSQYFFTDTTYATTNQMNTVQKNDVHNLDFKIAQTLDSLTELKFNIKSKVGKSKSSRHDLNQYISGNDTVTRSTLTDNNTDGNTYNNTTSLQLMRNSKKKDRKLYFGYTMGINGSKSEALLQSRNAYNTGEEKDSINQKKNTVATSQSHNASLIFTEPFTKKIRLEFSYELNYSAGAQDKRTLDFTNGSYSQENLSLSNDFETLKLSNTGGVKFIYEVKKQRLIVGAKARQASIENTDFINGDKVSQTVNNILPVVAYRYKFSDNQSLDFSYTTNSKQPDISQLQPVPDNSNTNSIRLGNPDLLPSFTNKFRINFNSYKPISGKVLWGSIDYSLINNAFSNAVTYDSIGRTVTLPVNVDGNYNLRASIECQYPLFKGWLKTTPYVTYNYFNNTNYINGLTNITTTATYKAGLDLNKQTEKLEVGLGANYEYNEPNSTLNPQSNEPYSKIEYKGNFHIQFSERIALEAEGKYNVNTGRSEGYNLEYFVLDASISRNFLKNQNLILSLNIYDLFNQNINSRRYVQDNVITDSNTNIISRYILFKATLKFNNKKTKESDDVF